MTLGNNGAFIAAALIILVFGGLLLGGASLQGVVGPPGPIGLTGLTGPAGLDGLDGVDGAQGVQGIQGIQGNIGPAGADGEDGAAGAPGEQGIQGERGYNGTQGIQGIQGPPGNDSTLKAYTLTVQALTSSPGDSVTRYFGNLPKAPVSAAGTSKVYIPRNGTIVAAVIYCYSGTAGTNENLSLYIRLNNSADTLIKTVGEAASERVFDNYALNIPVVQGEYFEIKCVHPLWATNPLTTIFGGYVYIE